MRPTLLWIAASGRRSRFWHRVQRHVGRPRPGGNEVSWPARAGRLLAGLALTSLLLVPFLLIVFG